MDKLQELQEKKNALANRMKELGAKCLENGKWEDAADAQNWDKINADYDLICNEMQAAKAAAQVAARIQSLDDDADTIDLPPELNARLHGERGPVSRQRQLPGHELNARREAAVNSFLRAKARGVFRDEDRELCQSAGIDWQTPELEIPWTNGATYNRMRQAVSPYRTQASTHIGDMTRAANEIYNAAGDGPLTTGTAGTGGDTIPAETFVRRLEVNMQAFGGMRSVAETIRTSSGEPLVFPVVDDQASGTRITGELISESGDATLDYASGMTSGVGSSPEFGQVTYNSYKYSSRAILVPYELIQDNQVNLLGYLADCLAERLARITESEFTTANGSSKPQGITVGASAGVTAASGTAITADEIIDLQHSVDPAYRVDAQFMMKDSTIKLIRKLKDGEGNYLWQPSYQSGVPDMLAGSRVVVNQYMPAATSGLVSVVYGQLSKYKIRSVGGVRFYQLNELYRHKDQTAFFAFIREDGRLLSSALDSSSTVPVKKLTMA